MVSSSIYFVRPEPNGLMKHSNLEPKVELVISNDIYTVFHKKLYPYIFVYKK